MRDKSDRYQVQPVPSGVLPKRLGTYLVDAGLLSSDQIKVVLNDQQSTGMRFGEIVAARGWLKEQTIEWIIQKVIEPERHQRKHSSAAQVPSSANGSHSRPPNLHLLQTPAQSSELNQRSLANDTDATNAKKAAIRRDWIDF
ncbi:MAG: hypothetical protein HC772_07810 [Leptolyngbyaceae cyanobacterium CRU_2_3]|nr:hypothetical protein [Leptolyngbyaceae cyanobacterium CRU_2_3]